MESGHKLIWLAARLLVVKFYAQLHTMCEGSRIVDELPDICMFSHNISEFKFHIFNCMYFFYHFTS